MASGWQRQTDIPATPSHLCLQATNGTNASVALSSYTLTAAAAAAAAATAPSPASNFDSAAAASGPSASQHNGRRLLHVGLQAAAAVLPEITPAQHARSDIFWLGKTVRDRTKQQAQSLIKLWHSTHQQVQLWTGQVQLLSRTLSCAGHELAQAVQCWCSHCTILSGLHHCTQSAEDLVQGLQRLLDCFASRHSISSTQLHWRLQFRGQPWWPFLPWQKADRHSRAERALAGNQGVDLVVTVNVPAGQNSSEATSSIEGPAFAPSLQQSLIDAGVLACY